MESPKALRLCTSLCGPQAASQQSGSRSVTFLAVVAVASAVVAAPVVVLAASVCWPSTFEASLTEAPAPSLFHVEVKMTLVGLIGARPQHRAKDAAGVVAHRFQECSFGVI
jgi:hypothetical protein